MGKGKVKPFQALKGQPNFTSCSKYSKIVCSMNLPREGDVVNSYLVVIVGYALFLILLGYGIGKHVKGASDFFVGGRSFSWKLLFTTLIAANIGAGSTVGVTGLAYRHGVSSWWWIGCSGLGSLILAYVVGPAVWRVAKRYDLFTMGDYLDHRYSHAFRGVTSTMMAIGTLALFSGQLLGIAWILNVVAGMPKLYGIMMAAIVVTLYFSSGGLKSSTLTAASFILPVTQGFLRIWNSSANAMPSTTPSSPLAITSPWALMTPPMPPGSLRPRPSSPSTTTRGPSSIRIQKNSRTLWRRRQVRRY